MSMILKFAFPAHPAIPYSGFPALNPYPVANYFSMISYHTKPSSPLIMPKIKIISGGQTGVDRAALDAALACKIECGGWCPDGRKAEDGLNPTKVRNVP